MQVNEIAKQLVVKMSLEDDDIEDIENDIFEAQKIWTTIVGGPNNTIDMKTANSISDNGPICKIMESLGATYSIDDHGKSLELISLEHSNILDMNTFADWYIVYLYKNEEDDEYNNGTDLHEDKKMDPIVNSNSTWNNTMWTVTPSTSVEGQTWKCNSCYVINKIESNKCISCEAVVS